MQPHVRNAWIQAACHSLCQTHRTPRIAPAPTDYSDESIAMRVGAVISHEFAHCTTLLPGELWRSSGIIKTLSGYFESTHVEAMADVIGVAGVLESGIVNWPTFRDTWGQLWCSRRSPTWQEQTGGSHPSSLRRADELAKVIDRFYPQN